MFLFLPLSFTLLLCESIFSFIAHGWFATSNYLTNYNEAERYHIDNCKPQ